MLSNLLQAIADEDKDCQVLNLGSGAGLHGMMALRAGAHHVTAVERWLYPALASKECLASNKVGKGREGALGMDGEKCWETMWRECVTGASVGGSHVPKP